MVIDSKRSDISSLSIHPLKSINQEKNGIDKREASRKNLLLYSNQSSLYPIASR